MRFGSVLACGAVIVSMLFVACGASAVADIQSELDNNPKLKQAGIEVRVAEYKDGFVTLNVTKGISPELKKALNEGKSLSMISLLVDMRADVLKDAQEVLKKRPDVKDVVWKSQ